MTSFGNAAVPERQGANLTMAQLNKGPIGASDLTQFVNDRSDFAFEMEVLAILRSAEFVCSHSGTYPRSSDGQDQAV